jgi:hypothetical protein
MPLGSSYQPVSLQVILDTLRPDANVVLAVYLVESVVIASNALLGDADPQRKVKGQ